MTDYYFVIEKTYNEELSVFEETWRSKAYNNMRTAHHIAKTKQKGKNKNTVVYNIELQQPEKALKY